jgi:hypothetical protein
MALIAPFYTMAGFSLYINRRIQLEAWDLEVRFRHLAETHQRRNSIAAVALLVIVCASLVGVTHDSYAAGNVDLSTEQSKQQIDEILQQPEFHKMVTSQGWRLKDFEAPENQDESIPEWLIKLIKFLEQLFGNSDMEKNTSSTTLSIAGILEFLMWTAIIGIAGYLIWQVLKYLEVITPKQSTRAEQNEPTPEMLFGLDVREDSIPDDLQARALRLWQEGRQRDAAGLLYRSTLSLLIHRFSFRFYDGYTEQECADIVNASDDRSLSEYVNRMTAFWQQVAYAHRNPADAIIQSLCKQWEEVFHNEN